MTQNANAPGRRASQTQNATLPAKGLDTEVEETLHALFKAYDLDESGVLSRDEFLKIEMRLCFEAGEVFHADAEAAKLTTADVDRSGTLDFEEFRERQLRKYTEACMTHEEIIAHASEHMKFVLQERVKMGPRYHSGIRQVLKRIFTLFDVSGDAALSPEEWISAQKTVALEVSDDIDEAWIDEGAFSLADTNGDGLLQLSEFLEASVSMFEGVKRRSDEILATLNRVVTVLEMQSKNEVKETQLLDIYVQTAEKPPFQPPHASWQDEPTQDDQDRNASAWKVGAQLRLPTNLTTTTEVQSVLRLCLQWPEDTWMSAFYMGPDPNSGFRDARRVELLRGEKKGEGNVQDAIDYLSKPNATNKLYVKNQRKRPAKLQRQQRAFLEERDALLGKKTGASWGLDWETQLVGEGSKVPPRPLTLGDDGWRVSVGDVVVIEVPQTDENGEYRYVSTIFMDGTAVLSKPVDENIEVKQKKSKKKQTGPAPDPLLQLNLVALTEGKCVFFVDVSWEDQEEKLCSMHKLYAPVAENTVARIGPCEVEVVKAAAAGAKDKTVSGFQWWNGEKWSNKKGPAKRKKRK